MERHTLYDIAEEWRTLEEQLLESGGDVSDEEFERRLTSNEQAEEQKLEGYAAWIRDLLARAEARRKEGNAFLESARALENAAERAKGRLLWYFTLRGLKRFVGTRYNILRKGNGGKAPLVSLVPEEQWPESYQKTIVEPDRERARTALESGVVLSFARLGERGEHIEIK